MQKFNLQYVHLYVCGFLCVREPYKIKIEKQKKTTTTSGADIILFGVFFW